VAGDYAKLRRLFSTIEEHAAKAQDCIDLLDSDSKKFSPQEDKLYSEYQSIALSLGVIERQLYNKDHSRKE